MRIKCLNLGWKRETIGQVTQIMYDEFQSGNCWNENTNKIKNI